jgi:hypothetical protein
MAKNEPPPNHALQRTAPWRHGTCSFLASLGQVPRRHCTVAELGSVRPMAKIMNTARTYRLATLVLILGCTAGCDQTSKHLARARLSSLHSITLPGGGGELRLAENLGLLSQPRNLTPPTNCDSRC